VDVDDDVLDVLLRRDAFAGVAVVIVVVFDILCATETAGCDDGVRRENIVTYCKYEINIE
jgi:hypothetical protein